MRTLATLWLAVSQSQAQVVDLTETPTAFPHFWKRCVGTGHMLLGTRSDWQEHLVRAKNELGFTAIRGHGLLDDDMSVVPRKGHYEFFNVDTVFDFLQSIGVKPVVELSFMPKALAQCEPADCTYVMGNRGAYKGLTMPPKDFSDWEDLIKALAEHLVDRYGLEEVSSWNFEVWNELWGMEFPHPYMDLYNSSARALKAVSPQLRVGGPATMQVLHVADFVQAVQAANLPMDFVSTHLYPTDPQCPKGADADVDCFTRLIHEARDVVRNLTDVEFLITEYNAGLGLKEGLDLDAPFGAAFAFRQVAAIQDVDMFAWWSFTDIFEEGWMKSQPFNNGFGLQTIHGVAKPSWRAFQLLKDAGDWRVAVTGAGPETANTSLSILATTDAADASANTLQLFVADWSPASTTRFSCDGTSGACKEDAKGSYTDHALCEAQCSSGMSDQLIPEGASNSVTITIKHGDSGIFAGSVSATMARIDDTHANAKAQWESMGRPAYLKKPQIDELVAASQLVEEPVEVKRVDAQTSQVTFELPPWSTVRVAIHAASGYSV